MKQHFPLGDGGREASREAACEARRWSGMRSVRKVTEAPISQPRYFNFLRMIIEAHLSFRRTRREYHRRWQGMCDRPRGIFA